VNKIFFSVKSILQNKKNNNNGCIALSSKSKNQKFKNFLDFVNELGIFKQKIAPLIFPLSLIIN